MKREEIALRYPPSVPHPSGADPACTSRCGAYLLPRIPYLRLRCTFRAAVPATLPPFKGSLLRGAFGHALRRAVCAMGPTQDCATCRLRPPCFYTRLFETFLDGDPPPLLRGLDTAPRPYIFEPGTDACVFAPGDPLPFDLLLVGQAMDLQAYALLALERMAVAGLGRERFRFELDQVEAPGARGTWQTVVAGGRARLPGPLVPLVPPEDGPAERALLRFQTPTRIKLRHHLVNEVDFHSLVYAMVRRVLELAHVHVPGAAIDWTFRPLLDHAGSVRVTAADLHWRDWQRYSNRQGRAMKLGGFEGTLEVEGDLPPFAPLLRAAEVLHVGKGATFGLGRMAIEARDIADKEWLS